MRTKSVTPSLWPFLSASITNGLGLAVLIGIALTATVAAAPPPGETPQSKNPSVQSGQPAKSPEPTAPQPLPAYPDLTSEFASKSIQKAVVQNFTGKLKRYGRKIYMEEEATSSGPIGYNEYFIYDLDKNMLYRLLRDEQVYFEAPLSIDQRVEAIRKGWVPAEGPFLFDTVTVTLSSRDIPLRPDTIDNRRVELRLREITAEIPAIGKAQAHTVKYYSFVWMDPTLALPVKISYGVNLTLLVVEYRNIATEAATPALFEIPKNYVNLTPY